jgi:hypothetical protein
MREKLPHRRASDLFECTYDGRAFHVGVGFFEDGRVAELFIDAPKTASQMSAVMRDAAVLISLALQYGTPLEELKDAVTRLEDGKTPASPISAILDSVTEFYATA